MPPEPLPLSFRGELVPHLFRAIRGGWSSAVVGVRGAGGSNLLRFLCEPRVVASHLAQPAEQVLFVYLEAPEPQDAGGLLRAVARRTAVAARTFGWPKAEQAALRSLAERIPAGGGEAALEGLLEIFAHVCQAAGRRAVLVFDEFDATFVTQPASGLRALRRLRDEHKSALSFVVGTRRELAALLPRRAEAEEAVAKFAELFDQHTFPLRPYSRQDAFDLMTRKTTAWLSAVTPAEQDGLYRATGGHAKLLVAGLGVLETRRQLPWPEIARALRDSPFLIEVCGEIWSDLDEGEQAALGLLAADRRPDIPAADLARVKLKGLAAGSPSVLFCDVFESFVAKQTVARPAPPPRWTSHLRDPLESVNW